ncbi:MAG: hypothetical protein LUQ13_00185 [Methanomicrobiales archaeon]|nr:hypothetical protein [Methanomicrobiales archaeon]
MAIDQAKETSHLQGHHWCRMENASHMRRRDRGTTDPSILREILCPAKVCRLDLALDGEPYVVPVCSA